TNKTDIYSLAFYYIISICMGFAFGGFTTYMPSLFASHTGSVFEYIPETLRGGFFTTLVFIGGIVGQTIGGVLGDKYNRAALLFFIVLINIPFFALMGYASGLFLIIVSLMLGIAHFSPQPISNALLAELTSIRQRGLGYGISFFLSFGIGGGIAPAVCGWIAEHYTISAIFPFMAISLLPAVISGPLLIKRFHHSSWNR
ncbi:MAG: MFS transporter, partial [Candidatus Neomarinimicrobiota bacterium]|nr:MFS transporter [Candidatus Neomarinimicrobiota bacterium]